MIPLHVRFSMDFGDILVLIIAVVAITVVLYRTWRRR